MSDLDNFKEVVKEYLGLGADLKDAMKYISLSETCVAVLKQNELIGQLVTEIKQLKNIMERFQPPFAKEED